MIGDPLCAAVILIYLEYTGMLTFGQGRGKQIEKLVETYPVILTVMEEATFIFCIKPALSRMGGGKGKFIGEGLKYDNSHGKEVLLHAYVPAKGMVHIIKCMEAEGIFTSTNLSVEIFFME